MPDFIQTSPSEQKISKPAWWKRFHFTLRLRPSDWMKRGSGGIAPELIPPEIAGTLKTREKLLKLLGVAALGAALVGAGGAGLILWQAKKVQEISSLTFTLQEVERELLSLQAARTQSRQIEAHMEATQKLIATRPAWSKLLTLLEETVPASVVYQNLVADPQGTLTLQGASRDIEGPDLLLRVLRKDKRVVSAELTRVEQSFVPTPGEVSLPVQFEVRVTLQSETLHEKL